MFVLQVGRKFQEKGRTPQDTELRFLSSETCIAKVNPYIDICGTSPGWGIDAPERVQQTGEGLLGSSYQRRLLRMSTYPPPGPGRAGAGRRIEEAIELIEMELRHAIAYVNDAVIPQIRKESISAMRTVSDTLRNLADRMEQPCQQPSQQPSQQPPSHSPDSSEDTRR